MNFQRLHPADQIVRIMKRLYSFGMTTTSGGNLSIKDSDGVVWISPGSIDKGSLEREDIMKIMPNGEVIGIHKPSVELPIHQQVYKKRPKTKAILHAHPPSLVAFSAIRELPAIEMIANVTFTCGVVRSAGYALPGSELLGDKIAEQFEKGADAVMMDNHGVIVASANMYDAFSIFETLDYCARIQINAESLGEIRRLGKAELELYEKRFFPDMQSYTPKELSSDERHYRQAMCMYIKRAYNQQLFTATQGTFSRRLPDGSILITPYGKDRMYLDTEDLVRIQEGQKEEGKSPSRAVMLHQSIYNAHEDIKAIAIAHPPNIMAFAVTGAEFDAKLIPESYIMLKEVQRVDYGANLTEHDNQVVEKISITSPICIIENDCVVVAGTGLLNVFDRLEVLEYSAKSVVAASQLQKKIHPITAEEVEEIKVAFKL